MKIKPIVLTVLTTDTCTAECAHCCMSSSPKLRDRLNGDKVIQHIKSFYVVHPTLELVVFAGGEPTLLKKSLFDAIEYCAKNNILTRMVTNASWAVNEVKAKNMINRLRQAGLNDINYSFDDYHLPFVPKENIKYAWRASKDSGFDSVVIANCTTVESIVTPDFISELLEEKVPVLYDDDGHIKVEDRRQDDGTFYAISNGRTARIGRGRLELTGLDFILDGGNGHKSPCHAISSQPAISPRGELLACCGYDVSKNKVLNFGDANSARNIKTLHENIEDNIIVNAIHKLGPFWLREFLDKKGFENSFLDKYVSMCEVCHDVMENKEAILFLETHEAEIAMEVLVNEKF